MESRRTHLAQDHLPGYDQLPVWLNVIVEIFDNTRPGHGREEIDNGSILVSAPRADDCVRRILHWLATVTSVDTLMKLQEIVIHQDG